MQENGFEFVDLGLPSNTMWATCNVGATKPEDPGLLLQWGRVDGYKYRDENNKFITNEQNLEDGSTSEYIPITTSGKVYKTGDTLDLEDDAAHVHMGSKWRMATRDEMKELYDNTTHNVETINGVKGMMFTSNTNGKQLFVPFAGYWYNGSFYAIGADAYVWSSQVHSSNANNVYTLYCDSSGNCGVYFDSRACAFSVRGVFNK